MNTDTSQFSSQQQGKTPGLADIHLAVKENHISKEEGESLNPRYNDSNKQSIQTQTSKKGYNKLRGKTPGLADVHFAVTDNHISKEEGEALNPKYNDSNSASIERQIDKKNVKAGKPARRKAKLGDIHIAVESGHISKEEGQALNPKYTDSNSQSIKRQTEKTYKKTGKIAPKKARLGDIHAAVKDKHITREEGRALNPKYNEENMSSIMRQDHKLRKASGLPLGRSGSRRKRNEGWGEVWK